MSFASSARTRHAVVACTVLVAVTALAGCGGHGDHGSSATAGADGITRLPIEMRDIAFSPADLEVKVGTTVEFDFENVGALPHEAYLGDAEAQQEHAAEMASAGSGDDHSMHHGMVMLAAGESGTLRHTFTEPGIYELGCHQPGHYEAGMKLTVVVR